jgi:hypothetical protein
MRFGGLVGPIQLDFEENIAQFVAKYDYPWP